MWASNKQVLGRAGVWCWKWGSVVVDGVVGKHVPPFPFTLATNSTNRVFLINIFSIYFNYFCNENCTQNRDVI